MIDGEKKQLDLSVDCVVFGYDDEKLKVLVIKRPFNNNSETIDSLPGDLILEDEGLNSAAERVLYNLTGINGIYLKQFHSFGEPDRLKNEKDHIWLSENRIRPNARVITIAFYSLVRMSDYSPVASSFASTAEWVNIEDIEDMLFDHNEILDMAMEKLRNDTIHNNISFELLPKKFTLGQLQSLYEIILNKKLDKRNFRKSIKKLTNLISTGEKQDNVTHKPAELFTYEKDNKE